MINYRLVQDKSSNPKKSGKWYAKAVVTETIELDDLSTRIQANCTAKKSDVQAVLSELIEVMATELQNGRRVKLNGFGAFKVGLTSRGAESKDKFEVQKHIKGLHIIFQPHTKKTPEGKRTKVFLDGARMKQYQEFNTADQQEGGEG